MPTPEDQLARLRDEAQAIASARGPHTAGGGTLVDAEAMQRTLHELQVHQIELEMQNEELRTIQVALDQERSNYQDLYDMAPVGYLTLNASGQILHTNLQAAHLLGLPRSQLVRKPLRRFVAKRDQAANDLFAQQVLHTGAPNHRDVQLVNAAGFEFWVRMAVSLQATAGDDTDPSPNLLVIISDISDRKAAEEKLYESEEVYRSLFNAIDEGFCIIEVMFDKAKKPVDFRYMALNPSFEKQSGLFNAHGRLASEALPGLEQYWLDIFGKVASTGESVRITQYAKVLNRWFDLFAFRTGDSGKPTVGVVFSDITDRKQVEADRLFLDQVLLHKNAELQDAQALAEKANQAKSDFLSGMSHELRTPLTAILGFAQLMDASNPALAPGQKRSLDQILKAGWYLLELINEILDLAVIESGKLKLEMQSVSVASVLLECEAMVEVDAQRRGISLYFEKTPALAHVYADRTRLKQALINLLSNAIKYNEEGGSVRLSFSSENPAYLRMYVEDTGKGLTSSEIAQLFQPFNRLGQESRSEPGTGIGLVVTKQLIELMGGSIGVNSAEGKGSVFWIELKQTSELAHARDEQSPPPERISEAMPTDQTGMHAHIAVQDGMRSATHPEPSVESRAAQLQHLRATSDAGHTFNSRRNLAGLYTLLYVEDNAANLLLMQELMARRPDVRLLHASDGSSGLSLARSAMPDLILLDTNLPGLSGLDVLRILANDPLTAAIPVLVVSANAMPHEVQAGLDAGCRSYLTKPIHVKELMRSINIALKLEPTSIETGPLSQLGELT